MSEYKPHDVKPGAEILIVKIGWCEDDDGGMDYQIIIGDGKPIRDPLEPWMLEAVNVAINSLQLTKARMEHLVMEEFIERGRKAREARKRVNASIMSEPHNDGKGN